MLLWRPLERPPSPVIGRLLFALDATLSRERTWDRAMHIQSAMFEEADTVNGLAMKLVYFRGYNECRASGWQKDGRSLARLMQGIGCMGGHTQIARVLGFARKEIAKAPVPALVYIGDAVEEDGDALSQQAGELGLLGCKLFMFHEGPDRLRWQRLSLHGQQLRRRLFSVRRAFGRNTCGLLQAVARYASGGRKALESAAGEGTPPAGADAMIYLVFRAGAFGRCSCRRTDA
jgi:hypothetical protein